MPTPRRAPHAICGCRRRTCNNSALHISETPPLVRHGGPSVVRGSAARQMGAGGGVFSPLFMAGYHCPTDTYQPASQIMITPGKEAACLGHHPLLSTYESPWFPLLGRREEGNYTPSTTDFSLLTAGATIRS
ncbi:hypothetical protein E2C01_061260 [Portunus trituberculatus]|uniref:Uncharacterized protein n=1 Tax=Portunus trituberculatus TaxID=210409 RepID=A0A5B7HBY3_PORTR|nr:hypothetical protein [Portunus trituberculatus]